MLIRISATRPSDVGRPGIIDEFVISSLTRGGGSHRHDRDPERSTSVRCADSEAAVRPRGCYTFTNAPTFAANIKRHNKLSGR
jgi:hypothetical protein